MTAPRHYDQDKDSTLYVGNLDERCTDALVWELMLQCGPIINVHLPKDRVTQLHQSYGFVEFASEADADYAAKIMNQIRLWGKPIRVNKASADKKGGGPNGTAVGVGGEGQSVGAELFVGNLDNMIDEKALFETFSRFGPLLAPPKVTRDDSNLSKGYGFISYSSFEASDDAIANMHGQYLGGKEITVQYAYKKDGKGERHGDTAERALAAQAKKHGVQVAIPAMPASLTGAPAAPAAPVNGNFGAQPPMPVPPSGYPPADYGGYGGGYNPAFAGAGQQSYNSVPPPHQLTGYGSYGANPAYQQQQGYYNPQQQQQLNFPQTAQSYYNAQTPQQGYYGPQAGNPMPFPPPFPQQSPGSQGYNPLHQAGYPAQPPPQFNRPPSGMGPPGPPGPPQGFPPPNHRGPSPSQTSTYAPPSNYSVLGSSDSGAVLPPPPGAGTHPPPGMGNGPPTGLPSRLFKGGPWVDQAGYEYEKTYKG